MQYQLGDLLIYGPLRNILGMSRLRVAYTAVPRSAPTCSASTARSASTSSSSTGQTETCAYVCLQPNGEAKLDSVGKPLPGVEVRIVENGEIWVKTPSMLKEYYKRPDASAESISPDGYFMTGDAGFFDDDGHLKIIDRASDVGKLADGAMFAPQFIENKLKFFPYIKEAVCFGDRREMVCAFINIDLQAVGNWAEKRNMPYSGYLDLTSRPEVYDLILKCIEQVNADLAARSAARQLAGPALPDPAQGTRRRRRRAHAHAQGAPRLRRGKVRGADRCAVFRPDSLPDRDRSEIRRRPQGQDRGRRQDMGSKALSRRRASGVNGGDSGPAIA